MGVLRPNQIIKVYGVADMTEKSCIHYIVSGRVQGVWFRAGTREQAQKLGLTGWVRNLPGGEVEVTACGPKDRLEQLHQWLHQGPRRAEVTEVSYEELPWQEHIDFIVK